MSNIDRSPLWLAWASGFGVAAMICATAAVISTREAGHQPDVPRVAQDAPPTPTVPDGAVPLKMSWRLVDGPNGSILYVAAVREGDIVVFPRGAVFVPGGLAYSE